MTPTERNQQFEYRKNMTAAWLWLIILVGFPLACWLF